MKSFTDLIRYSWAREIVAVFIKDISIWMFLEKANKSESKVKSVSGETFFDEWNFLLNFFCLIFL